ncbi:MAG: thioredoxin-dependent thiol peroxidase [Actinomycetota bacterium]
MAARLAPGRPAPDFTLPDAEGRPVSLADLRGRRVVVYFYPKAATPGCTTQACDFRDSLERFTADGFAVVGISPDPPQALAAFAEKEALTFPLLSDADHRVAEAYGAWGEKNNYGRTYEGLVRSTVVVGPDGDVELAQYNVRATGHVAKLRRDLGLEG